MSDNALLDGLFRREYPALVATLVRRVGVENLAAAEDAAQGALAKAIERWPEAGVPESPPAWLFRVAYNALVDELRGASRRERIVQQHVVEEALPNTEPHSVRLDAEMQDDLLRMVLICCDPAIPEESQLALALKVLCGFDVPEIALRLFTTPANIYKRVARARTSLRNRHDVAGFALAPEEVSARVPGAHRVIYQLFTEGHLSHRLDHAIRIELCREALRLALALAEHSASASPTSSALVALVWLHLARMPARIDPSGGLLLLEEHDRSLYDEAAIAEGIQWLARSAEGATYSRYHAEAAVAAEHCLAPSFDETRWERVVAAYHQLDRVAPSPWNLLNRAVATAEWQGPDAGLAVLHGFEPPTWLAGAYSFTAVLADLHRRAGHTTLAARYREVTLATAPAGPIRCALARRLSDGEAQHKESTDPPAERLDQEVAEARDLA